MKRVRKGNVQTDVLRGAAPALAALLLAASALAQPQRENREPAADTPVFLERLEVEIVNVDVVITDRRGNPVEGLTRADFELRVNGEPTSIDNFYAVGPQPRAEAAPEASDEATLGLERPPEHDLHLLVLFDNVHATPGERKRAADDLAASFEAGLGAGSRAAVGFYDGGITVRQPFTTDSAAVAAAIRAQAAAQIGFTDDFERRSILREIQSSNEVEDARSVLGTIENYAERHGAQVRATLDALGAQVDSLAGLPGRKVLLFVTAGLDLRPGQALFQAWQNKFSAASTEGPADAAIAAIQGAGGSRASGLDVAQGQIGLGDRLRELTRRANAGRVALYAIGTAGAGPTAAVSAEDGGFDFGAFNIGSAGGGRTYDVTIDSVFRANLGSGLELMAQVTGGDALTGSGNYDLIAEQIQQDAGYRYSLGFRAPVGEPGTSHRIEVEVPGHDARLRYRREFVTATPVERGSERTLAALLWGHADNGVGIAADIYPAKPSEQEKDLFVLPVLVKVPLVNLVLLPEQRFHRGQITIFVVAEDDEGRVSPVQTVEVPIRIPTDRLAEALAGVGGYRVGLLVRPGPHRLAIGVRDDIGDVISTIRLDHDVVIAQDAV